MRTSPLALAAGLLGLTSLLSCVSRPPLARERFAFTVPAPAEPSPAATARLAIPSPEVAAAFDRASLVYRTGEGAFEPDPYAQLLAPPRELLGEALRGHLRASGRFGEVTRTTRGADLVARVTVTELYGDFRDPQAPAAVLTAVLAVDTPGRGGPAQSRTFSHRVPIAARRPEALARGLDEAVGKIAAEMASILAP